MGYPRLLLERVTLFVREKSLQQFGEIRRVKLEFSSRGGLSYGEINAYYEYLKMKVVAARYFLPQGDLVYETIHRDAMAIHPHKNARAFSLLMS